MSRKKKNPAFQGVKLPTPSVFHSPQLIQFKAAAGSWMSGPTWTHFTFGSDEEVPPEPKDEPKTEIGLMGYRLYTLDNELYLVGAQGNKQKGQESEPAQHNGNDHDYYLSTRPVNHPAPAWDCLCGFAAFFWPTSLEGPGWKGVLAEVQAGGRTICCEEGWRAERIILNKLWIACPVLPNAALEILRKRYEVPVEVL